MKYINAIKTKQIQGSKDMFFQIIAPLSVALLIVAPFVSTEQASAAAPFTVPTTTVISQVPQNYATTNGDILTTNMAIFGGTRAVMVGGNFSQVTTPDGVVHPATNFAILDLNSPNRVMYAAQGVNSYVRESYADAGILYVAGDFTTFAGQPRNRLAAIGTDLKLRSWNPGSSSRVEALAASNGRVYYGGNTSVLRAVTAAYTANPGALIWSKPVTDGSVRAILVSPNNIDIYVGGLFETLGNVKQHGLVRLVAANGTNYVNFKPVFMPDTGVGPKGTWNGDCILSLAFNSLNNTVVVGSGGSTRNQMTVINATTGSAVNAAWSTPNRANAYRNSEGDVQAVAVVGDALAMGYHRGHVNGGTTYYGKPWPTKRFLTMWNYRDGSIQSWDAGLWGAAANTDEGNGGVQAMVYDAGSKKLIVGGAFRGYGDPYNNVGGTDIYGQPGIYRQSLSVFTVQ